MIDPMNGSAKDAAANRVIESRKKMFKRVAQVVGIVATLSLSTGAAAVQVTLTDSCAGSVTATGAATTVDSSGSLGISGANAPYSVLFGCDPAPPATPSCALSASQTRVAPNVATTLFTKCSSAPNSYAWNTPSDGPTLPAGAATLNSFPLTFPSAGAYTYSVAGTNGSGQGPVSNQLTILVGDSSAKPACTVTASPIILVQNGKSKLQVACNPLPTAAGYSWAAPDAGAPAMPAGSASAELTFPNAGTFTYRVQGTNGVGTGAMAGTIVTVLGVQLNPTVAKAFNPASVNVGANATLTITLGNSNAFALTGAALVDTYPSGLVNSSSPSAATTCTGGTVSATAGGSGVSLSGANIPASGSCTVTVSVTSAAAGSYVNTIPVGGLTTANAGSNTAAANATLTVNTASSPPQYRASSSLNGSGTLAFPAGTIASDWLVLYVISPANSVPSLSGWTLQTGYLWTPSYGYYSSVFTRQAGAAANVTVTNFNGAALMVAYQNASGIGAVGTFLEGPSSTIDMPSIVVQDANSVVLGIACDGDPSIPTPPPGFTTRATFMSSYFANIVSERAFGATGATGIQTFTQLAGYPAVAMMIELKP